MSAPKERPTFTKPGSKKITLTDKIEANLVVLKFREGTRIRLQSGKFVFDAAKVSPIENKLLERVKLQADMIKKDLSTVNSLLQSTRDLQVKRVFERPEEELDKEKQSAETRSDEELADPNLYYYVGAKVAQPAQTIQLIEQLNALSIVETAYPPRIPYPAGIDISPTTPFLMGQGYLDAPPDGIGARFAWAFAGGKGRDVRLIDIEGAWRLDHEDLPAPSEYFYNGSGIDWWGKDHGTAVLGVIGARENLYGMTGIAPQTELGVGTWISLFGLPTAIDNAAARLRPGDVLLIEVHYPGPTSDLIEDVLHNRQRGFVPVEFQQAEYDAIRRATARGIIVVEAAGNGSMDLDMPLFERKFDRTYRDSQAILVGAGTPRGRRAQDFSNFGARVDVQGWGSDVATLGYGDVRVPGAESDERQWYTMSFGGTSSASPIVASAAACLQGIRYANGLPVLNSVEMRQLLQETGTPQDETDPRHIGPLPNLRAAIDRMGIVPPPPPTRPWDSLGGVLNSAPDTGRNTDGRMEVFVLGADQQLWHQTQTVPSSSWGGWTSFPPARPAALTGRPVVIRNNDGRLEVFARGNDNAIYHIWQTAPGRGWAEGWDRLGGNCTSDPAVGVNHDGRLEVFVRWADGSIHHYWQMWVNGGWYTFGWQSLGGGIQGSPTVGRNQNGKLEVFVRGNDDYVYSKSQITPGGGWADWGQLRLGRLVGDPVAALHSSGRLVVFGQGFDNALWCLWQTAPNSGWIAFDWQSLGGNLMRGAKVTVTTTASGDFEVFARWNDNTIQHCSQIPGTQTFSGWTSLEGSVSSDPAVGMNADNRLEVFARGADRSLVHKQQPF